MLKTQNMDINVMETASQLNQYYWELLGTPQMIMSVACLRPTMRSPTASNAFKTGYRLRRRLKYTSARLLRCQRAKHRCNSPI